MITNIELIIQNVAPSLKTKITDNILIVTDGANYHRFIELSLRGSEYGNLLLRDENGVIISHISVFSSKLSDSVFRCIMDYLADSELTYIGNNLGLSLIDHYLNFESYQMKYMLPKVTNTIQNKYQIEYVKFIADRLFADFYEKKIGRFFPI